MAQQNQPGSGVLFKNKNKKTDNHPDYTGSMVEPDGTEVWLSAWINKSKSGTTYMSLKTGGAKEQQSSGSAPTNNFADFDKDEDIPF